METQKNRILQALVWFLPTWLEVVIYLFICGATVLVSNLISVRSFLYVDSDFNPIASAIDSINQVMSHIVGENIAGSLSLAIFWGMIGVIINIIWVVIANFSTELNNDLVFSSYVHPRTTDPKAPLRQSAERFAFRFGATMFFLFYCNFVFRSIMPAIANKYAYIIQHWSEELLLGSLVFTILAEVIVLHGFVILTRLILQRKQVFSR